MYNFVQYKNTVCAKNVLLTFPFLFLNILWISKTIQVFKCFKTRFY